MPTNNKTFDNRSKEYIALIEQGINTIDSIAKHMGHTAGYAGQILLYMRMSGMIVANRGNAKKGIPKVFAVTNKRGNVSQSKFMRGWNGAPGLGLDGAVYIVDLILNGKWKNY